jgi:hypothetical protein
MKDSVGSRHASAFAQAQRPAHACQNGADIDDNEEPAWN